MALKN